LQRILLSSYLATEQRESQMATERQSCKAKRRALRAGAFRPPNSAASEGKKRRKMEAERAQKKVAERHRFL